mmetsp:Transcript_51161/g.129157  ORF Transcript_51161/g.129157 Transcript_51161/m.129157 type:complete len:87 (+) Transcript_51161:355-615(+)
MAQALIALGSHGESVACKGVHCHIRLVQVRGPPVPQLRFCLFFQVELYDMALVADQLSWWSALSSHASWELPMLASAVFRKVRTPY